MSSPARGYVGLAIDQVTVAIDFGRFVLDDFEFDFLYVENTIDPPPLLSLKATPTARILTDGKVTGCHVELSGAPDTVNYVLRWGIAA
jgi:hypothetical protein